MPLFITKINEASTNISLQYLESEHSFGFLVSANYKFSIIDVEFQDGDDNIIYGIDALERVYSRPNIAAKIGVDEFKNGLVTSINYDRSDNVRESTGTISIEERVRVDDDGVLSELFQNIPSPQDVESFSESFVFSRSAGSYSRSRNVSLKYRQDAGSQFFNKAYLFLKNIYLGSRPAFGYQEDDISEYARFNLNLKPIVGEFYDEWNKQVTFTETFESSNIASESGIVFSKKQTNALSLNTDGYTENTYTVEVNAKQEPLELIVSSGIELSLSSLISQNTGDYGYPFSIEKTINSDGGIGLLSVSFSNDPRKNSINNIEYDVNKTERDSFDNYTFNLKIKSRGRTYLEGFENAKLYFSGNRNLAYEKIPIFFSEISSGDLNEISRSVSFNQFNKSISENVSFSNNPAYADEGDGILKRTIQVSDTLPVNRDSIIPVYGRKELIIKNSAKKIGTRSVSVDLVGVSGNLLESLSLNLASGEIPSGYSYYYMTDKKSSLEPLLNKASANLNFIFFD